MTRARMGLAVLLIGALAAGLSFFRKEATVVSHRQARQLVLHYTLSRVEAPIILVGDSITEASTLPRALCGHPIVNAGLNGASTASDLGTWLVEALDGKRAASIVVSLGTNDAFTARSTQAFEASYAALLGELVSQVSGLSSKVRAACFCESKSNDNAEPRRRVSEMERYCHQDEQVDQFPQGQPV